MNSPRLARIPCAVCEKDTLHAGKKCTECSNELTVSVRLIDAQLRKRLAEVRIEFSQEQKADMLKRTRYPQMTIDERARKAAGKRVRHSSAIFGRGREKVRL